MNFEDVYDDLPVGVCVLRRNRKNMEILFGNAVLGSLLQLKADKELTGKKLDDIWPHQDIHKLLHALKGTNPPQTYTLPVKGRDNTITRWIKIMITRDLWHGEDCHILWMMDVSSNIEHEEQLREELERADAMAKMKGNFLATMSHEIRTPMQTIFGLLELITEEKPDKAVMDMTLTARDSASGLLEILDDILDIAKMDAEKMELDVFEVPVRLLVRGILEALSVKAQSPNVELIDEIEENVPFVVIGDPKRLRQIIMNLAGNAIKFTKCGHVKIRVTTKTKTIDVPDNHVGLRFEIIDTGPGMPQEVCDRLFQSFMQADNTTSRKFGGTGLGLSICKKLVTLMGGQIGVRSTEGQGSTFWFEIPTEEVDTQTTTIELPNLEGISVLSVEDHPQGAKEIVNSLRSMGAHVENCPTYAEGLELVNRRPFDVAIIDQGLPDGVGFDLVKEITKIQPSMGLIMYTVRDDKGLQHSLQSLGATYLSKPASRAGLGEAVRDCARKPIEIDDSLPKRLLIAEDTEQVRDVLRRQLNTIGADADFVNDGMEALEALKSGKYGLLITDLHMPEMDGYGLVEAIREKEMTDEKGRHFPVIVLTADVQMAQRQIYLRHGFDECLLKPVSLGQFKRLLIRWGLLEDDGVTSNAPPKESPAPDATPKSGDTPPAIDMKALEAQMGEINDSVIEMLGMFTGMTQPILDQVVQAQAEKDYKALKEAAHSLKGAARSAGCMALGEAAANLQDKADTGQDCTELIKRVQGEFTRADEAIKSLQQA